MKNKTRRLSFMSLFLATAMTVGLIPTSHAQDYLTDADDLLQDGSAIQLDDINIDGKISPSELMRKRREKLEDRNKTMVERKIEDIRVKQEVALTKKLNDAFTQGLNNLNEDKVEVKQAAPLQPQPVVQPVQPVIQPVVVETRVESHELPKVEKNSQAIPYIGGQSIKNGNSLDIESQLNLGLSLETKLDTHFSLGLNLGYTTLSATDTANVYNVGQTAVCTTTACGARDMSYSKITLGGQGKYYFSVDSKFKPYLGLGLDFNRMNLKYDTAATYVYTTTSTLGNEGFASNYFSAQLKLGAEVAINETMGLNLEVAYAKALSNGFNNSSDISSLTNPDQLKLENVSNDLIKADVTSIAGGFVIKF